MKRLVLGLVVLLMATTGFVAHSTAAVSLTQKAGESEYTLKFFGFSQFDMRTHNDKTGSDGLYFQAQRIRLGTAYFHKNVFGFLLVDFNQPHDKRDAGLPKVIKDAFAGYRFSDAAFVRMGMMKAPSGMTFTTHSWNLDIAERNHLDKGLLLERDFGLMVSGRQIGFGDDPRHMSGIEVGHEQHGGFGLGYDIGVFNPAGRSDAVVWDESQKGDALAYAGRLHFDYGLPLHAEAGYGISENAGGILRDGEGDPLPIQGEDYQVFSSGVNSLLMDHKLNFKAEFVYGQNIQGLDGWDQSTFAFMGGYMLLPNLEGVGKVYVSNAEMDNVETDLTNIYFGLNFFLDPLAHGEPHLLQKHRIQLNYVLTDGDDDFNGLGGHTDDTWILQWQYVF